MATPAVATVTVTMIGGNATVVFYPADPKKNNPTERPTLRFTDTGHPSVFEGNVGYGNWGMAPTSSWFYWGTDNNVKTKQDAGVSKAQQDVIVWNTVSNWAGASTVTMKEQSTPSAAFPGPSVASTTAFSTSLSTLQPPDTQLNASMKPTESSTAISSTATPTTSLASVPDDKGRVSSGAVAGAAVGCLVAGALIASLITWLFMRRSQKQHRNYPEASALALMDQNEKSPTTAAKAVSLESAGPVAALSLENGLPQPLEDKAITGEITKINNSIKNHVQSYYHTRGVSPGLLDFDDLQALGNDLPISTSTLSTLLGNSEARDIALRFCIAWVTISRMHMHGDPATTFLPPEIASCFKSMSFAENGSKSQTASLAKWRVLSAQILRSKYTLSSVSPSDPRNASVEDALRVLDGILQPFADPRMDSNQRRQNLEEVLRRAAIFAFTLFSQPSTWDFDWQEEQGVVSGSLCVFPALVQTVNDHGELVRPPRAFNEAVVRNLYG